MFGWASHSIRGGLCPVEFPGKVVRHSFVDEGAHAGGKGLKGLGQLAMAADRKIGGCREFGGHLLGVSAVAGWT